MNLPDGHAVIYGSYGRDEAACSSHKPKHFSAHVFLPGVVIAIGEPRYKGSLGVGDGTCGSWRGLESVIRGLRLWRPHGGSLMRGAN